MTDSPLHPNDNLSFVELLSVSIDIYARLGDFEVWNGGHCAEQRCCGTRQSGQLMKTVKRVEERAHPPAARATVPLSNRIV